MEPARRALGFAGRGILCCVRRRIAVGLGSALVIILMVVAAFFLGGHYALDGLSTKRVTATEIANAMRDDRFYSDFGQSTLLVEGTVSSLSRRGSDVIAEFKTDSSFQALCDLGSGSSSRPQVGKRITLIAEGARADRQPSAVFLRDCVVL